jgi:hypothetical protein
MSADWLAGPGTFWILGLSGIGFIIFYIVLAIRLGKAAHSEGDGCLLAFCNSILVVVGGAAGFLALHFPAQLMSAMAGSAFLPALMTLVWIRRLDRR